MVAWGLQYCLRQQSGPYGNTSSKYTMSGFIARSHVLQYGVYRVGYAVVSLAEVIEAKFLLGKPLRSRLNGLIALTRAFCFSSVKTKESPLKLILCLPGLPCPCCHLGGKGATKNPVNPAKRTSVKSGPHRPRTYYQCITKVIEQHTVF